MVRIGAASNTGSLVAFVGVDKGFFAKHGIDGKVVVRNTGPELSKSLNAGEIDFAPTALAIVPVALERGLNVRSIVGFVGSSYIKPTDDNMLGIVVQPGSAINSIADLKGKKVGITFGTSADFYFQEILKKNKLPLSALTRMNVPPLTALSLFDGGGAEAMVIWEPYLTSILDKVKGSKIILRGGDHVCFCASMHAIPSNIYKDPDLTQRVVHAMSEAAAFVRDPKNLDEVGRIGARYVRGMDAELIKRTHKYWVYDMRIGKNTFVAFNASVKQLIAQKKMKKPFDPARYYDITFIKRTMELHPEWFKDLPGES
ncbi:MAG: ABC transporter substrate-binding protein [Candidatus Tectomicrobia bacterium]|uniref:ABC transporter substrate-binding protein n=1 Tax=Tectimicrobiota bacterium TaxID=2528274 RepID=A0A932I5N2_UNCTE|nr:ABC transporter substrate-binding protein [Candidatus Tectomicrobia bacterium]